MNARYLSLGAAFGIPIRLHWTVPYFLLGVGLFSGIDYAIYIAIVLFVVLLHEYGHSLVAQRLGVHVTHISIFPFGGMAHMAVLPERPRDELLIAIAGPATNLLLAAPFLVGLIVTGQLWAEPQSLSLAWAIAFAWTVTNLALGIFNLLPAFPMDGGRILRALLVKSRGYLGATELAVKVGRWLAGGMLLLALFGPLNGIGLLFIAGFVWVMGGRELFMVRMRQASGFPAGGQAGDPREVLASMFAMAAERSRRQAAGGAGAFGTRGGPGVWGAAGEDREPADESDRRGNSSAPPKIEIIEGPAVGGDGGFSESDVRRLERFHGRLPKRAEDDDD